MTEENELLGTIQHDVQQGKGTYTACLVRSVKHGKAAVWQMLVDPANFVNWLAPGSIDLVKGGAAKLDFSDSGIVIDSIVTDYEDEALLEYSWSGPGEPARLLRWTIIRTPTGSELSLVLKCPDEEDIAKFCAGWEAHLMMLLAALEGVPIKFPFERFQTTREAYNKML